MAKIAGISKLRSAYVANSHWLAEIAERSPIVKACGGVRVIPPGIDTDSFQTAGQGAVPKLDLPEDAFVIVGRRRVADR